MDNEKNIKKDSHNISEHHGSTKKSANSSWVPGEGGQNAGEGIVTYMLYAGYFERVWKQL